MGEFEDWEGDGEVVDGDTTTHANAEQADRHVTPRASVAPMNSSEADASLDLSHLRQQITNMDINDTEPVNGNTHQSSLETPDRLVTPPTPSGTQPVNINVSGANEYAGLAPLYPTTSEGLAPDRVHDGPMTPRNDIGPFVLDGNAGRSAGNRLQEVESASSDSDSNGHQRNHSGAPSLPPVRFD
jgi:hypothetical protein